ncbi:MAG: hypothetical protein LBQ94_04510 [Treponema sp.]|jgi:hypothetical protein|nr:hypothetical protein [Treponema sp.]
MANFVCPFRYEEYDKSKVLYVCGDCGDVVTPKTFESEPIKCKSGHIANIRKCPICGNVIPATALQNPNLLFSIVGGIESGKTNYITVMLEELRNLSDLSLALAPQNDITREHQNENFRRIYEGHTIPEVTRSGTEIPQIWSISNLQRQSKHKTPTYTFTIYDGAGEDYENNFDPSTNFCRYVKVSKSIILTVDPLVLSNIRRGGVVDPDVMRNSLGGKEGSIKKAEDVVNSAAAYIKNTKGIRYDLKLSIPVAVVLTKFDTILNHKSFGPQALIRKKSLTIRDGKVDTSEIEEVNDEIRNWLKEIRENNFINTLETHFKEFKFFGVSSFGASPKADKTLAGEPQPHRVLDPLLWLFQKARFID